MGLHAALFADGLLELLNLAGADDAVGLVVDVAIDEVAVSFQHAHFLLAEGAEEVFHQAPVEVGPVFVGPGAFEIGELTHLDEGVLGGGNEAFLLVEIEEHVEGVTHLGALGNIAFGQQDVANLAAFEIDSVVFLTQDFQLVAFAQLQAGLRLFLVRCLWLVVRCHS